MMPSSVHSVRYFIFSSCSCCSKSGIASGLIFLISIKKLLRYFYSFTLFHGKQSSILIVYLSEFIDNYKSHLYTDLYKLKNEEIGRASCRERVEIRGGLVE